MAATRTIPTKRSIQKRSKEIIIAFFSLLVAFGALAVSIINLTQSRAKEEERRISEASQNNRINEALQLGKEAMVQVKDSNEANKESAKNTARMARVLDIIKDSIKK